MKISEQEIRQGLVDKELVRMSPTGEWMPTREGYKVVGEIRMLTELVEEREKSHGS